MSKCAVILVRFITSERTGVSVTFFNTLKHVWYLKLPLSWCLTPLHQNRLLLFSWKQVYSCLSWSSFPLFTSHIKSESVPLFVYNSSLYAFMSVSELLWSHLKVAFSSPCCLDAECSAYSCLCAHLWPHHIPACWPMQDQHHVSWSPLFWILPSLWSS